ncbi:hypothetical protein Acr_24g0001470 [Actinidia rufa]|uniref:Bet v I/Major latex protein domain-containing protein n=1 Tax=Actinidia rufa TaxID=165716 RepID=A0A7J0GTT0_9ERIC|nr:hypothetical protein Acr_24g0001440 [Actinidia rufa]GFZ13957.1 hypothetical protein Acr_24g0001470 [Actinidia rufa]
MGVFTYTEEHTSPIPLARAFKAMILDADKLIPKLVPQAFKSIEVIQGNGGHRIDEIDEEKYKYCYTLIEGDVLAGKLEKIVYEIQLVATADGGTITKTTSKYYTLGDAEINEEEIKGGMEKAGEMFKVVEDYLIKNPDA